MYVKERGKTTINEYKEICNIKKRQATNDLKLLENKNVFERVDVTGKDIYYILRR